MTTAWSTSAWVEALAGKTPIELTIMHNDGIKAEGEQWLQDWCNEPGLRDDDRADRAWMADNWRNATLQWAISSWFHERQIFQGKTVAEFNACNAADDDLKLYARERNGLLVWRAYREFREAGMPVPEVILAKLDEWADRLEHASGQAEVARAIEMTGPKGGAQGAQQLRDITRRRNIASDVHMLVSLPGRKKITDTLAFKRVAERRGMKASHVKSIYYAWMRPSKAAERKSEATTLTSVMQVFGKVPR